MLNNLCYDIVGAGYFYQTVTRVTLGGYVMPTPSELEWYSGATSGKTNVATTQHPSNLNTSTEVLAANPNRKKVILQNVGTVPIYVFLGDADASSTNYSFVLQAGPVEADGRGGAFVDEVYSGAIRVLGASAGAKISVVEM
jgi:hypothetical protein